MRAPTSEIDLAAPDAARDPYPHYEVLRRLGPVVHLAAQDAWIVLSFDGARMALTSSQMLSNEPYNDVDSTLLGADPDQHDRVRGLLTPLLAAPRLAGAASIAASVARRAARPNTTVDAVRDIAHVVSRAVAASLFGIDAVLDVPADLPSPAVPHQLHDVLAPSPLRADLVIEGSLGADEIDSLLAMFWSASTVTTERTIAEVIFTLLTDERVLATVRDTPAALPSVVGEVIRLRPSEHIVRRRAVVPVTIDGVDVPSGALVLVATGAANRDPSVFADPAALRLDRPPTGDLSFGAGVRRCIGAALARRVVIAAVSSIVTAGTLEPAESLDEVERDASLMASTPRRLLVRRRPDAALVLSGVGKRFTRGHRRASAHALADLAAEVLGRPAGATTRTGEFWALDGVDLELLPGEAVGVVGPNGAGKSTLLRLAHGVLRPDRGVVWRRGTTALVDLATGFDLELTARENIAAGAALAGLSRRRGREMVDEVVDFAELGSVVDVPLRSYSSGMRARLGVAAAIAVKPTVLLMDEALAVGDLAFRRRCTDHLRSHLAAGGSALIASHSTYLLQTTCARSLLLRPGAEPLLGPTTTALDQLLRDADDEAHRASPADASSPSAEFRIDGIGLRAADGDEVHARDALFIVVECWAATPSRVRWGFNIWTADQEICVTGDVSPEPVQLAAGQNQLTATLPRLPLVAGRYALRAGIIDAETDELLVHVGWRDPPTALIVHGRTTTWSVEERALGQLVALDVEWGDPGPASPGAAL